MSKAPAVDYALRIIEFFAESQSEVGIADICNSTGINKNAASRVLDALLEYRWIYISDVKQKKYRFTMKPFSVVSKCVPQYALSESAKNELEKLNHIFGDAVYLGVKNERNVLYLLHFDSTKEVRINGRAGGEYPLHCSAPGKVLLAYDEEKGIREYFDSVQAKEREKRPVTSAADFIEEAEEIRERGYALDKEEFARGIICIACPIFDDTGKTVASVGISSLTIYDSIDSLVSEKYPLLKEAARNISLSLGYKEEMQ